MNIESVYYILWNKTFAPWMNNLDILGARA